MGLKDVFNIGKIAKENAGLKELMSPEFQNASVLNSKVAELEAKKERLEKEIDKRTSKIDALKKEAVFFEDAITFQEFGLYTPRYDFVTSEEYKEELDRIRDAQKKLIKNDKAIIGATTWTVNGSKSKGNKMIADMKKLFLRAFNSDCEDVISKVKYNNFDMSLKKIRQSANSIEKLGKSMSLQITQKYIDWKEEELTLAFEYQQKRSRKRKKLKKLQEQKCEKLRDYKKKLKPNVRR